MGVYKTLGAFSWSEPITGDPAAASAFYGKLFGWAVQAMDVPGVGRPAGLAVLADPQGATFNVMQYSPA